MHSLAPIPTAARAPSSGGLRQDDLRRIQVARQRGHGGPPVPAPSGPAATAPGAAGRPAAVSNLGETRSPAAGASPAASAGRRDAWRRGMAPAHGRWRAPPTAPCGLTRGHHRAPAAGACCGPPGVRQGTAVVAPPLAETPEPRRPGWGRRGPLAGPLEAARTPRGMATPRHGPARALARPPPALVRLDALLPRTAHRRRAPGAAGPHGLGAPTSSDLCGCPCLGPAPSRGAQPFVPVPPGDRQERQATGLVRTLH